MNLPAPLPSYDRTNEAQMRRELEAVDKLNVKRGQDIEMGSGKLILTDTVDGSRWYLTVTSGALSVTAV